jgi:hypothetical protein
LTKSKKNNEKKKNNQKEKKIGNHKTSKNMSRLGGGAY